MALEERPQLKKLVRILKNTYDERFASFCRILKGNMEAFALNLRQNGIIGDDIFEKKEYSTMVSQFKAGLDFKRDWRAVEQHCQKFLDSLSESGPQPQEAAEQLKESWQRAVLREMGMMFLPVEVTRTGEFIYLYIYNDNANYIPRYVAVVKAFKVHSIYFRCYAVS